MADRRRSTRLMSAPPTSTSSIDFEDAENHQPNPQVSTLLGQKQPPATSKKSMPTAEFNNYSPFQQGFASFLLSPAKPSGAGSNGKGTRKRRAGGVRTRLFEDITHELMQEHDEIIEESDSAYEDEQLPAAQNQPSQLLKRSGVKVLRLQEAREAKERRQRIFFFILAVAVLGFVYSVILHFRSSTVIVVSNSDAFEQPEVPVEPVFENENEELILEELDSQDAEESTPIIDPLEATIRDLTEPESPQMIALKRVISKIVQQTLSDMHPTFSVEESADYALASGGAMIIRELTSPTYPLVHRSLLTRMLYRAGLCTPPTNQQPKKWPDLAIQSSVSPGECWQMLGGSGRLTIKLSRKIRVDNFTLEHVSRRLALGGDLSDAPRNVEVYGLLPMQKESANAADETTSNSGKKELKSILLARFMYQIKHDQDEPIGPVQNFKVDSDLSSYTRNPIVDMVQLRVLDNWGKQDYTCIYRFRVHGRVV